MTKRAPRPGEGRPTKYLPSFVQKADEYLALCGETTDEFHKTRGDRSNSYERIINVNLPTLDGFSKFLGVNNETVLKWAEKYDEFSEALDKIRREQHLRLLDGGLSNRYSPVITKLLLYNHGYKEKTENTATIEVTTPDIKQKVDNAIEEYLNGNR